MQASNHDIIIENTPVHTSLQSVPYLLDVQDEDSITIDIIRLYQELLPSKESHDRRIRFVKKMERLLNHEWPNHDIKAHVFGSSVNDLGTTTSDVDLCITTPWTGLRNVRLLAKLFRKCGMQHIVCVPRAKVPIVRLFDPELQLSCDINVNNTLALQNTKMIKNYVALDPRVRPLIMVIKHWTKQRALNDAANGGTLSSYTWTCMIINFLQQRSPPVLPILHQMNNQNRDEDYFCDDSHILSQFHSDNNESLGGLLYSFFRRYALEFDYDEQVVSVRHGCYLSKTDKGWDTGRNRMSLCVEEPFNVSRNLGNSADVSSVLGLRTEFQRVLDLLLNKADLHTICIAYQPKTIVNEIPLDNNMLSLTLPSDNKSPLNTHPHPHDRRRSMVDGICSSHIRPPWNHSSFHPRFSSNQALDTILKVRNTRHGSHPLISVPPTLLSMYSHKSSVDNIFARYLKRPQLGRNESASSASPSPSSAINKGIYRRKKYNTYRKTTMDWPAITPTAPSIPTDSLIPDDTLRSRRWSTPKHTHHDTPLLEPKKKTLAEIVKVGTPAKKLPIPPTKPSHSTVSNASSNDSKTGQNKPKKHRDQKGKSISHSASNKTRKKNTKSI